MPDFLILPESYYLSWEGWFFAALGVGMIGMSKAGLKGTAILTVTIMALLFGSKASTGILVPMLIGADILAVIYYHRDTQWKYLRKLLPWMVAGILLGAVVGEEISERLFKLGMAGIILLSVVMMYWWDRREKVVVPDHWWFSGIMGMLAGFCTMIGNLAGAFSNIYFLAMRLPKNHFIGTAAWLFLITNTIKIPFHIFMWKTITADSLALNLRLMPGMLIGFFAGVQLVKVIKEKQYRKLILILTAIGAVVILFR